MSKLMNIVGACAPVLLAWSVALTTCLTPAVAAESKVARPSQTVFYGTGRATSPDEQSYALVRGDGSSLIISGNGENVPVDELKRAVSGDFIWFRDGERTFIIVDQSVLARSDKVWKAYEAFEALLSQAREKTRAQVRVIEQMESGSKDARSASASTVARLDAERKLATQFKAEKTALEQSRTEAYRQAHISTRALIDEAVKEGKMLPECAYVKACIDR